MLSKMRVSAEDLFVARLQNQKERLSGQLGDLQFFMQPTKTLGLASSQMAGKDCL